MQFLNNFRVGLRIFGNPSNKAVKRTGLRDNRVNHGGGR
jgi:hypothetical protein